MIGSLGRHLCRNTLLASALVVTLGAASLADAQTAKKEPAPRPSAEEMVQLDFKDVDLGVVIEMIARTTGKNFIYDEKVRGKVTVVSPTPVTVEQAYAVFESILKTKKFTVVEGPAGVLQIIPVREAKESNIETVKDGRASPNRDHYVTRLIPLLNIDAEAISNTIKPLVSKDASMVAYPPTNTIILTDTASNIRRLLTILDAIDVETHKEELAVIKVEHADAGTLGNQISEIYGAEVSSAAATSATAARRARSSRRTRTATSAAANIEPQSRGRVRIITDNRTNSLIVLAARQRISDIRSLIKTLDVPVIGGGSIHVYYLKHADAEELAQTLNGLLTGQRRAPRGGGGRGAQAGAGQATQQAIRAAVTSLSEGIQLNADPATNSLVIQASKEAYETLIDVIKQLDIERPQVLVESLIMEVNITGNQELGMDSRLVIDKSLGIAIESVSDAAARGILEQALGMAIPAAAGAFAANLRYESGDTLIQAVIRATAADANTNIVAAPHLLTSDNEEAEIQIGQNIPIITNRINTATGNVTGQTTSVAVERQDVGVILRVTPQISEGNTLRLQIFQENTTVINDAETGDPNEVGVALSKRAIENTLVVADGQTVVIGGLLSEDYAELTTKTPFLGDIPILGWLFKTRVKTMRKINLLVFLTPHIVRSPADLERETIRKRRQFEQRLGDDYLVSGEMTEEERRQNRRRNPVQFALSRQADRYPLARMREIEEEEARGRLERQTAAEAALYPEIYFVTGGTFHEDSKAASELTVLLDRGYDATLVSGEVDDVVVYQLRVGPYDSLDEAEDVAEVLGDAFGLSTGVVLQAAEEAGSWTR